VAVRGFTLVELLVTVAIMALVMTALLATLQSTVKAHDVAAVDVASVRDGPRILDMVERDLHSLHVYNLKDGNVLKGVSARPGGLRGDRIDFVAVRDSSRRIADPTGLDDMADVASSVNEVGYRLRPSASNDFLELWRREDLFVDDDPFDGGTFEKIHDHVTRFEITYLDHLGDKAEEATEWDMTEKKKLPGGVRIDLELQISPEFVATESETAQNEKKIYHYMRVVAFADSQSMALNVRPYLPTKITGRNDNGGTGGAGGSKGKGKNGDDPTGGGKNGDMSKDDLKKEMEKQRGGNSVKDFMDSGGGASKVPLGIFDGNKSPIDIRLGADGGLSQSDLDKLDQFMNDYRNRFSGKTGLGFGPKGGKGGGGASPRPPPGGGPPPSNGGHAGGGGAIGGH
jgi:type II secretion system protein J